MQYPDLITLPQLQSALTDLTAAQLADAPAVNAAVSRRISARDRRGMAATVVQEETEIGMNRSFRFAWRPVLQVLKVEADQVLFCRIANSGPATEALVTLNVTGDADALSATGVTLTSTTAGVAAAPIVLDWTTYPTVQALVDHINTLGSGWSAAVQGALSDQPDLRLVPTAGIVPDQGGRSALRSGVPLLG